MKDCLGCKRNHKLKRRFLWTSILLKNEKEIKTHGCQQKSSVILWLCSTLFKQQCCHSNKALVLVFHLSLFLFIFLNGKWLSFFIDSLVWWVYQCYQQNRETFQKETHKGKSRLAYKEKKINKEFWIKIYFHMCCRGFRIGLYFIFS